MTITLTINAYDAGDLIKQIERLAVQRGVGRFNVDEGAESVAEAEQDRGTRLVTEQKPTDLGLPEAPKRKRRTKAEIEADKAAEDRADAMAEAGAHPAEIEAEQAAPTKTDEQPKPEPKTMEAFAVPSDVDGLRNILRTIASTKSPQAAAGVLTAMQYTKVSDVPKEKYGEFAAMADKAIA